MPRGWERGDGPAARAGQQVADDAARVVDVDAAQVAGVQPLEQQGEPRRVGPHEPHRAVTVPRLQREVLRGGLRVRPGDLEDALAAHPDEVAAGAEQPDRDGDGAHAARAAADGLELPLREQVADEPRQGVDPVVARLVAVGLVAADRVREVRGDEVVHRVVAHRLAPGKAVRGTCQSTASACRWALQRATSSRVAASGPGPASSVPGVHRRRERLRSRAAGLPPGWSPGRAAPTRQASSSSSPRPRPRAAPARRASRSAARRCSPALWAATTSKA